MKDQRPRTQPCGPTEAAARIAHARKYLEVASIVATEKETAESNSVAASLAVLAGIAAADAACCQALGRRSRSQNHRDAEALLAQVHPGGPGAAKALQRLLDVKDVAHYGLVHVGHQRVTASLRHAGALVEFAASISQRR